MSRIGCILTLVCLAVYIGVFVWMINNGVLPHVTPTAYHTFWWGMLHGSYVFPTFIVSLFDHSVTIYQAPNSGFGYNIGFMLSAGLLLGGSSSQASSSRRR